MPGGSSPVENIRVDYSSTNVTTGAYVTLDTALDYHVREVSIFDSGGFSMKLAIGPASGESDFLTYGPGGTDGKIPIELSQGARLSIRGVGGSATTGELIINFWG